MTSIPKEFKSPRTSKDILKDIQDISAEMLRLEQHKHELWCEYELTWIEEVRNRLLN